jgi:hypothetical protein
MQDMQPSTCSTPNTYLSDISQVGARYHLHPNKHTIILQQSKPYRMRKPMHQVEFFKLAMLFNYMVSGKSHIGYLCNKLGNIYARES